MGLRSVACGKQCDRLAAIARIGVLCSCRALPSGDGGHGEFDMDRFTIHRPSRSRRDRAVVVAVCGHAPGRFAP